VARNAVSVVRDRASYAGEIKALVHRSVRAIIDIGKLLVAAKADLAHGEFEAMVREDLSFDPRTAQRLMAIAQSPALANPTHVSLLPPSWGTLYELSRLPEPTLARALTAGEITPKTQRQEAIALVERERGTERLASRSPDGGGEQDHDLGQQDLDLDGQDPAELRRASRISDAQTRHLDAKRCGRKSVLYDAAAAGSMTLTHVLMALDTFDYSSLGPQEREDLRVEFRKSADRLRRFVRKLS